MDGIPPWNYSDRFPVEHYIKKVYREERKIKPSQSRQVHIRVTSRGFPINNHLRVILWNLAEAKNTKVTSLTHSESPRQTRTAVQT
jgi:hypothetical protein